MNPKRIALTFAALGVLALAAAALSGCALYPGLRPLAQGAPASAAEFVPPVQSDAPAESPQAGTTSESEMIWPPAYKPSSHARAAGVSAARKLLGATTTLPTVSAPPDWADPFGGIIDGVKTNDKVVALTFDDGPTAHTRKIVDDLEHYGAHATFFWVGSRITTDAAEYSLAHGEELANHTWNHPNMWKLSSAEASAEIGLTSARIAQFTGAPPVWFRSPFNRLYRNELKQIHAHRLLYANYNVTSVDWMKGVKSAEILLKLDESLKPGGVILMHDSPGHDPDAFLPDALELLRLRGYKVVTLTELAQMGAPINEPLVLGVKGLGY